MRELPEVLEAKVVMNLAMSWSVVKWLKEKKRVRRIADRANEALDKLERELKDRWPPDLKGAYDSLESAGRSAGIDPDHSAETVRLAKQIHQADEAAYKCRMDAEATFDEAERKLSTSLAREGCRKAIRNWELHEAAIRKAEAAAE